MDQGIKKHKGPKVSVHVLTKNRAALLPLAIESALNQNYTNLEIIIIDNNSTDNTEELVKKYQETDLRIKYFRIVEDFGITKSRNFALSKSTGKYIAILDSDDFWMTQDKIEKQVAFLENNSDYAIIGTDYITVDIDNKKIELEKPIGPSATTDAEIKQKFLLKNQMLHSSVLISKQALQEINGYDESFSIWEDYATFLKIGREHKIANLKDVTTAYRKHGGNVSKNNKIKNLFTLGKIILANRKFYPSFLTALFLVKLRIFATLIGKY